MKQRMAPAYMIDAPSPYETTETWESFLKTLASLPQDDPAVEAETRRAREIIAEKKAVRVSRS